MSFLRENHGYEVREIECSGFLFVCYGTGMAGSWMSIGPLPRGGKSCVPVVRQQGDPGLAVGAKEMLMPDLSR